VAGLPDVSAILSDNMRAAVYRAPGEIRVETCPLPRPGAGEVLLEIAHCGICGTDLHLVLEGWGRPGTIPGHEYSATVVAVGEGVENVSPGDRVIGGPPPGCGSCDGCRAGRTSLCSGRSEPVGGDGRGAFAEYQCVDADRIIPIPDTLSLREAALAEPLAVALHGVTQGNMRPGERALVSGLGPIGLFTVAVLRARGVDCIRAVEPGALRRDRALAVGASEALIPEDLLRPKLPFEIAPDAVDVVFECSGAADAVESGLSQLRRAGRLVLVGTGMRRPRLDTNRVLLNELTVTGAFEYDDGGLAEALALLATGALPVEQLAEPGEVPLDGLLPAMQELATGRIAGKVLVTPR